jgi:5-methylcytosine-specific restriction endonuclease McrA
VSRQVESELLAHLCHEYEQGALGSAQFADAVEAIVGAWDVLTASMLFSQAEATVKQHFCQWWVECDEGCVYRREPSTTPPWRDGWRAFVWGKVAPKQSLETEKRSSLTPKDARSVVTPQLRRRIFARDGHKCKACSGPPPLELDHIIPVSKGGSSEPENLQSLCVPCNRKKGASILEIV